MEDTRTVSLPAVTAAGTLPLALGSKSFTPVAIWSTSQGAALVAALLDVIPSQQCLVHAMSSIMKRLVLTVDDLPLSHSFRVKTVLYIVVIVTNCIVLSAIHTAIAAVVVRVGVIATTLAGKSKSTFK
jgi:hypothetical protein